MIPIAALDDRYPQPWSADFWFVAWGRLVSRGWPAIPVTLMLVVVLAWPWLSLATLLLYAASMRRAKVNRRHVMRVAVYGCDFGLLMAVAIAAGVWWVQDGPDWYAAASWLRASAGRQATPLAAVVLACGVVATYRLSFAYARYLRFDRPVATVVASQVIAVLGVAVVLVTTGLVFPT